MVSLTATTFSGVRNVLKPLLIVGNLFSTPKAMSVLDGPEGTVLW